MFSLRSKALALVVAAAVIGAPVAQAEFIPGVTDFPSRVPASYVPGVTDFPSRLGSKAEQAAVDRIARRAGSESPAPAVADRGFDWGAAGIGAAVAVAGLLLAAAALRTRLRAGGVLAHQAR